MLRIFDQSFLEDINVPATRLSGDLENGIGAVSAGGSNGKMGVS